MVICSVVFPSGKPETAHICVFTGRKRSVISVSAHITTAKGHLVIIVCLCELFPDVVIIRHTIQAEK
jgi:hypothetical protein